MALSMDAIGSLAVALFPLGALAGAVATLAMNRVMDRLSEGWTPPAVASGVLTETHPDDAPERLATVVHYVAGLLTGPLYVWLLLASATALGDLSIGAVAVAAVVLLVLMVAFFAVVVLPRASGLPAQRLGPVRRDWTLSAVGYLLVLVPIVGGVAVVLSG